MLHDVQMVIFSRGGHPGIQSAIEGPMRLLRPVLWREELTFCRVRE